MIRKYTLAQIYEDEKRSGFKILLHGFNEKGWRRDLARISGGVWDWSSFSNSSRYISSNIRTYTVSNRKIFDNYINYMDSAIESSKKPYSAKTPDIPLPNDPYNEMMGYVVKQVQFRYEKNNISERFLLLQLALRAYKLENGKYPYSLSELAPNYLTKVPVDPFGDGKTFIYNRTSDRYILYSLGPDCKDDGGRAISTQYINRDSNGDIVFGVYKRIF